LSRLGRNYKFVVIDNEAGMEHLSRRTVDNIDKLLLVSDPTAVGIQSAIHAFRTAKDAGVKIKGSSLIINKSKGPLGEDKIKTIKGSGLDITGYIPFQEEIERNSEKGNKLSTVSRLSLEHLVQGLALNTCLEHLNREALWKK